MKRRCAVAVLIVLSTLGLRAEVRAQAVDTVFVGSTHSATAAGFMELIFPTAGFAYAGDWHRGFFPNAFRVAAGIGFGLTADEAGEDACDDDGWCTAFSLAVLATTVWSIVGAVQTAHDYNAAIREVSPLVSVAPAPYGGVSVGVRVAP